MKPMPDGCSETAAPVDCCECSSEPTIFIVSIGPDPDGHCCEFQITPEQAREWAAVAVLPAQWPL